MKKILAVIGPTASGKTDLAISLAKQYNGEIVSVDSRQIYLGMDIGTAKAGTRNIIAPELKPEVLDTLWQEPILIEDIPHFLIDIVRPDQTYSAFDFSRQAEVLVEQIWARNKVPILAGGTGLYFDAFLYDFRPGSGTFDEEIKAELSLRFDRGEAASMHKELSVLDPDSAAKIHPHNKQHLIRALEFVLVTGKAKADLVRKNHQPIAPVKYFAKNIDRQDLYARINARVDAMIANGLVEETITLRKLYNPKLSAMTSIGYKEIGAYLDGELTLLEATELIKKHTRNYAKRQLTWFRRYQDVEYV